MKSGVIGTLRRSPILAPLEENELRQVAAASRGRELAPGEILFAHGQPDRHFYILQRGRIALQLRMSLGRRCGGETRILLDRPGQTLGWSALVRAERISASARAIETTSVVVVDLERLARVELALRIYRRLVQQLYGLLQETGLCPPDLKSLLAFGSPV